MRFNFPLKTVMVLTLLTWPTVLPAHHRQLDGEPSGVGATDTFNGDSLIAWMRELLVMGMARGGTNAPAAAPPEIPPQQIAPVRESSLPESNMEQLPTACPYQSCTSAFREERIRVLNARNERYATNTMPYNGPDLYRSTYAAQQAELYQLQNPSARTITGIARDGTRTTIYCNPGPCTMGSVLRHVRLSGLPPMVPLTLWSAVSDLDDSFDSAFEETNRLMQTSEFRGTDGNAASAYRVPAYTTILAEVSRQREANEKNDGKVIDGVLMDVTVQYEPPETTTVTTYVDAAETEDQRKTREDRAEADRLVQAFEQRHATNLARDAQRRADNPGPVTPVVTQPTMPAAPTW